MRVVRSLVRAGCVGSAQGLVLTSTAPTVTLPLKTAIITTPSTFHTIPRQQGSARRLYQPSPSASVSYSERTPSCYNRDTDELLGPFTASTVATLLPQP